MTPECLCREKFCYFSFMLSATMSSFGEKLSMVNPVASESRQGWVHTNLRANPLMLLVSPSLAWRLLQRSAPLWERILKYMCWQRNLVVRMHHLLSISVGKGSKTISPRWCQNSNLNLTVLQHQRYNLHCVSDFSKQKDKRHFWRWVPVNQNKQYQGKYLFRANFELSKQFNTTEKLPTAIFTPFWQFLLTTVWLGE